MYLCDQISSYSLIYIQNSEFWARREAEWEEFESQFPDFVAWNKLRKANKQPRAAKLSDPTNIAPQDNSETESDPEFQEDMRKLRDPGLDPVERRAILDGTKYIEHQDVTPQDDSETESDQEFQEDMRKLRDPGLDPVERRAILDKL